MTQTFKVDLKHQAKSLSNGLWNILIIPVVWIVLWFWKDIHPFEPFLLTVLILYNLFWFIPAFVLHPTYYFLNKSTILEIDRESRRLYITTKGQKIKLEWNELKEVERIFYSDYRHIEWQQNWIPMPWRNYGLLRIQTSDNQEHFLTSLMIDIVNPPIEPTKNTFKLIPLPSKSIRQRQIEAEEKENTRRNRIDQFKKKFNDLSEFELKKRSESKELVDEAKIASQELILEKHTIVNKQKFDRFAPPGDL